MNHTSHVHLMMSTTSWQMPSTSQSLTLRSHFGNFSWMRKAVTQQLSTPHLDVIVTLGYPLVPMYQEIAISDIYGKLDNVIGIADDLLIWGNEEDGSEHDRAFQSVLETTHKNNLKLNIAKIQYHQKKVTFFGETYTVDRHQPMPDKVQAVAGMTTPTSVTELQCFLGMCNFLSKFSPRMAEISEPLHQLTCKGIPFIWGPEHTEAFQLLKREISTAPILRYYDPKKPVVLQTDACIKGLGAVLLQDRHPVYFASKSLTAAQLHCRLSVKSTCSQRYHQVTNLTSESDHCTCKMYTR